MTVTGIVLSKDERYNLADCLLSIKDYLDEVIVINSDENSDIAKQICEELECKYYNKKIDDIGIKGIGDLRNFGNTMAKNDWIIHVDVDELFSDSFLKNINDIVNKSDRWACKFPRINLPFYEKFPDYQIRLMNRKHARWVGTVHEEIEILDEPKVVRTLDEYPIIHKKRNDKIKINKRWKSLAKNKILILSLFNDNEKWIDEYLKRLKELIDYSTLDSDIKLLFLEGNSKDNTYLILDEWIENNKKLKCELVKMDINSKIPRFERLAILRNMAIKLGIDKEDYDYIFFIDSDTIFDRDLLTKLKNSMIENNCNVIAPIVCIENFQTYGNSYFYDTLAYRKDGKMFMHWFPYVNNGYDFKNKIVEVDSVGTCYLCKTEIYNINDFQHYNVMKCYKENENKVLNIYTGENDSEQVEFFNRAKEKGYKILVDFNIKITHINLEKFGLIWH